MSWAHASKKQREKLLELIRRLAEDDKEGIMAHKVGTPISKTIFSIFAVSVTVCILDNSDWRDFASIPS